MKKLVISILMGALMTSLVACGSNSPQENTTESGQVEDTTTESKEETTEPTTESGQTEETSGATTLVVYFSATGTTKKVAEEIANGLSADTYEIVPAQPYTDDDLNYNDNSSRSTQEMNDSSARPEISGNVEDISKYETIYIGYPIWWGEAPRILDTFVESQDFTNKTVVPFCTSSSSGMGSSAKNLETLAGTGTWVEGQRFSGSESSDEIMEWVNSL